MKTLEKDLFELIDEKLSGELAGEELEAFDKELKDDPELMAEFELHAEIDEAIQESEVIELRKKLDIVHDLTQNKKQPGLLRTILRHKLSRIAAASFIVLLIITSLSLYFLRPDGNMSNDSLFKIYYQPDAALLIRGTDSQNATLIQAFQLYENKEYSSALDLFAKVLENDADNIPVKFYSGISNIELGQYRTALQPFNFIMNHKQNLYVERAEWFAALCYLKLNETDNAIELFRKVSHSNSFYKENAHEILQNIQD
ncbi:MAG: tetratricopeptide repeat protein [Bacteroidales bacterium]|jgi:tetratricopeptide (TPR) repeat protein|nr:tetratricopeptide repeat protein [Bacteroidales bacterium]